MRRTEIDGVPVVWAPGPEPLHAVLTFGCGVRDESFRTIGVTHLIEHLAMSALPRLHHDHNASVDLELTQFFAAGPPEHIVSFLALVCEGLADLPVHRLSQEAGVLAAEGGCGTHPTAAALCTRRFGLESYGLAAWAGPGFDRISADMVRAHAARFFVNGNAVLQLTGPPPAGLRLPLPAGPRPAHDVRPPAVADGPRWFTEQVPSVGVSLTGTPDSRVWTIGLLALAERLRLSARHDRGLSYDIGAELAYFDSTTADRMVWIDAREGQEREVAEILWDILTALATDGPTAEEIGHEVQAVVAMHADPRSVTAVLDDAARCELFDRPHQTVDEFLRDVATVTPEEVAARFEQALRTALLVVPEYTELELTAPDGRPVDRLGAGSGDRLPDGQVFRPSLRDLATSAAARRCRMVLTPSGVAYRDEAGEVHEVRFDDVVGVQEDGDGRIVFGRDGSVVPVHPSLFRGVRPAVAAVDAAVPAGLRYRRSQLVLAGGMGRDGDR